ncbi:family 78 glycoside hydrolase catalytic domain [Streptomyces sp. NPDC059639]|uniref:family 78 glycoside hydrolase catalytic domain n=1 Tax=Streptomyces sp. NPDC059639 TaxID=3346891 RepID=UPI00369DD320
MTTGTTPAPTARTPWAGGSPSAPHTLRLADLPTGRPRLSFRTGRDGAEIDAVRITYTLDGGTSLTHTHESGERIGLEWPFAPLGSRASGAVRAAVRVAGRWSPDSAPLAVETGLLCAEDWTARFITPVGPVDLLAPAPLLTRAFTLPAAPVRARLHVTALGVHVTHLNGARVGDEHLAPGWTSYPYRLRHRAHDVTALLHEGSNELTSLLGNGWYRGKLTTRNERANYGERLALLAQLEIDCADGSAHRIVTDGEWHAHTASVLADDLYDGQTTDLRRGRGPASPVEELDVPLGRLFPADTPPVREVATVTGGTPFRSPSGALLVDFGENLVGWVRLRVRARPGQEIAVRHAEVLEHGELGTRPLNGAAATDRYFVTGEGTEALEPQLTFHGFRYAALEGVEPEQLVGVEAAVLSSDLRPTGTFSCSEPDVRTLHANVVRGMRGNFLDLPTDCPQRDERLGWTGDIQIFAPTAAFLADSSAFLTSWLRDLAAEQHEDGAVPFIIPDVHRNILPAAAAWGDAAVVVPWVLYERYGDAHVLREQYPSMRAWVERIRATAGPGHVWEGRFQFGDWLDPAAPPESPGAARTDKDLVATACYARVAGLLAASAEVIGEHEDAARYGRLAADIRAAFAEAYVTPAGRLVSDTPTAYAMALCWDLLPDADRRARAGARLADLVRAVGFRIATGFVGTPLLTDALTDAGHPHLAHRLLLERGCPSWLYPVTMGATTIWERWDSMLPDGSINPGHMTSFNHYALGAVADWLHRRVAGLAPAAPGYREIAVRPLPGHGIDAAEATHETPYGTARVAWEVRDGELRVDVEVPAGAHATLDLPGAAPERVGAGDHHRRLPFTPAPARHETIADAVDDAGLWRALTSVLHEEGLAADEAEAAALATPGLPLPLTALAEVVVPRARRPVVDALRARLNAVLAGYGRED